MAITALEIPVQERLEEGHGSVLRLLIKTCKSDVKIQKDHKL